MPFEPGEIYWCHYDSQHVRPVVILSRESLNRGDYLVCVPFTSKRLPERRTLPNCVYFRAGQFGLLETCVARAEGITMLHQDDILVDDGPLGTLDDAALRDVVRAIGNMMGAECEPT